MTSLFQESLLLLFSSQVVSDFLWPHGLQRTRLPCPSPSPRVFPSSCLFNQWCHSMISSSAVPFSSCLQSFPKSGSFPMNRLFTSDGQSIRDSASVLPMNIQGWFFFRIGWFDLLEPMGFSRVFSNTQLKSINSSVLSFLYGPTLTAIHDYWRNHSFDYVDFFGKVMSLLFNMLSRLVITFLPRNKNLLISWLQSPSAHFGAKENKVCHCFHCFPVYIPWSDGTGCYELSFLNIEF